MGHELTGQRANALTRQRDGDPRILIIRTDRMGDVILSTPVIRALRQAHPEAYLAMMVAPANRELVEGNPDLNAVVLFDQKGEHRGWRGTLRLARLLKAQRFDTALILHSTNRVVLVSWLAGIPRRIGYARRLPWLLTHRRSYVKRQGQKHELEYNLDLLALIRVNLKGSDPIGSDPTGFRLFVPTTAAQEAKVDDFLKSRRLADGKPLIAIHPGASCPSKRWRPERFAEVADRLAQRHQAEILVVTGPDAVENGRAVARGMRQPAHEALGLFSLGETAALLKRVRCLISNDSGPVHLACAVGTPVVSIFGRWGGGLSPRRWGPTGERSVALHRDVGCRPCLAHRCPIGFICLDAVRVEEVVAAAEHIAGLKAGGLTNS